MEMREKDENVNSINGIQATSDGVTPDRVTSGQQSAPGCYSANAWEKYGPLIWTSMWWRVTLRVNLATEDIESKWGEKKGIYNRIMKVVDREDGQQLSALQKG